MRQVAHAVLAAAAWLAAGSVQAGYFGVGAGQNSIPDWDDLALALDDGSFISQSSEDSDTGFRVFGGGSITESLSFEVGYSDFGEVTFDAVSDGCCFYPPGPVSASAATTGIDFGVVGTMPLSDSVRLLGRVGFLLWETDFSAAVAGGSGSDSDDGNDLFVGFGLAFDLSPTVSLRGEFSRFQFDDADVNSLSLSLVFRTGGP